MANDLSVVLPQSRIDEMQRVGAWPDKTLLDYFAAALELGPERAAVTSYNGETGETTRLSYGDLDRLSKRFALRMLDLGVGSGDVVALQLPNWWQCTALHLACVRIGAICNILMPIFRERELRFMLGLAEAKLYIGPARFRGFDYPGMMAALVPELPALKHLVYAGGEAADGFDAVFMAESLEADPGADKRLAPYRPAPNDVNELAYTSGTTGEPKGVMNTANTTFSHLDLWLEHHGMSADLVVFMASPLAHRTGFLYGLLTPIMAAGEAVLLDRWDPPLAVELIEKHRCTFTIAATPFLSDIVNMPKVEDFDLSSLGTFVSAGAPIPPALVQRAIDNFSFKVMSGWGMSECGCPTICAPDDPPDRAATSDGKCLAHSACIIHDETGREVPRGEEGILKFQGSSLFVGYLKRPELYDVDADGWFNTGDLARMDGDGYIRISGRAKDLIIRGGENVPVVEVEQLLYRHPAVLECAVIGVPDERLGERGLAYVIPRPGQTFSMEDMLGWFDEHDMAKQYWPENLHVIEEMPRTPSGKIQKFKLREMAAEA